MIKRISKNSILLLFSIIFLLVSCGRNIVFTDSAAIPEKTWQLMTTPEFKIPIDDTINGNNVYFTLRTGSSYPFRNIFLFVTTTSPKGVSITDTLQYFLADEKGKWYGKGFGDIHEINLPFKSNVFFPAKGTYNFKIQHGMRVEDLKGVYDVGMKIVRIKK